MSSNKSFAKLYIAIAITIFAGANSVSSKLADIGMQNTVAGRNPISFCNLLFVGNLVALLTLATVYGGKWQPGCLSRLSFLDWIVLLGAAIVAGTIAPTLTFLALQQTSATNVVLVSRIQSPITLALFALMGDRKNWWIFTGEIVAALGIMAMLLLQSPENYTEIGLMRIGNGELLAMGGAICLSLAKLIRGTWFKERISLGVWAIIRTAVGTVAFAALVAHLFTLSHFMDVFHPLVWRWVALYGVVIVAGGQILWFKGLETVSFQAVSYAGYLIPIAGVAIAYFILGEVPTVPQYIGIVTILIGSALNQIGIAKSNKAQSKTDVERFTQFQGI